MSANQTEKLRREVRDLKGTVRMLTRQVQQLQEAVNNMGVYEEMRTAIKHAGEPALWEEDRGN